MKKIYTLVSILLVVAVVFSSCTTTKNTLNEQPIKLRDLERDAYVVLNKAQGESKSFTFWLLFIPIGGKSDQKLYEQAYDSAVKSSIDNEADGLLEPRYSYKKTRVPLILFGFVSKKVTAEGRAFRIKTEEEYEKSKIKN